MVKLKINHKNKGNNISNYQRANTKGGTYFFTVVTHQRRKIICDDIFRHSLREAIQQTRQSHPFAIDAWVLLPDHLHCIWTLPTGDSNFSARWGMIKRKVTKQCQGIYHNEMLMTTSKYKRRESTIWQRRFWEHEIKNDKDFQTHCDYLHFNPVKHGLVSKVEEWKYSSFHRYVKEGIYTKNWGECAEYDSDFGE